MRPSPTRRRGVGLAVGSIWLVVISAVFGVVALVAIDTPAASWALAGGILAVVGIVAFGTLVIRRAGRLRAEPPGLVAQGLGRRFAWIVALEVAAFVIANSWAAATGRFALIPSLDLIIVGLHFFPLARLFQVPRYHLMAIGFCAIPVLTLVWLPPEFLIGHAGSWYVVPSLGCGLVASSTAVVSLMEAWRSSSDTGHAVN